MKAAHFYTGSDIRVEEVPDPAPGPGEVLVRVKSAGICGSDLHTYRRGVLRFPERAPLILGHELAGEVAGLGSGVTDLRIGQRVGVEPLIGCGRCPHCRMGDYHRCAGLNHIGNYYPGGFAQLALAPRGKVFPLPDHIDMDAAGMLDVYACGIHAIHRIPVGPLDTVLVIGGGAIGLAAAQVYKAAGARRVYVLATHEPQVKAARAGGADAVINPRQQDPVEAIMALTEGTGVDITIEAVGGQSDSLEIALQTTARGGTVGVLGSFPEAIPLTVNNGLRRELNLLWIYSYALWKGVPEFQIALDMLAENRVDAKPIISHVFPLDDIVAGFQAALHKEQSGAVKVMIHP
jgi:2-desacetyl-2-hydroxyethyl bacteriochlorophyllide A dehydrogenase